jgi:para-aminobenzoate synthetase / 4-amino-4-deoxychorismate lyase
LPRVFLRTPWNGPWRHFTEPAEIFTTSRAEDVRGVLAAVDAAVHKTDGCAVGFVAYEAAAAFGLPALEPGRLPLVWFGLYPRAAVESLDELPHAGEYHAAGWTPSISHDAYRDGIRSIRRSIEAGDTYQINYTWRLRTPFTGDPLGLAADLIAAQRGAWSAYLDIGAHVICSASPELFVLRDGTHLECRPMKGTAPRGLTTADDQARAAALAASEKNRAENVMVVDMTRNDLGRLARVGSVAVPSLFAVERYPAQWQMVSTVTAEALQPPSLVAMFEALFPSGSITGAPKHSSMRIISGLEGEPRGIYTGAIGIVERERAHFNVAIRTVHVDRDRGTAEFGVGSGIVWDSVERDEYEECLVKASILSSREPEFDLLESIKWTPGEGFALLEAHFARLRASAAYFGRGVPSDRELRAALERSVDGCAMAQKVRLLVNRSGGCRAAASALASVPDPRRAALAADPIGIDDVFLYHKTTRRAVYETAARSRPDADVVILWNARGEVTEAADANVVVERDGRRVTPPVASGLLPGVYRGALLEQGAIGESVVTVEEIRDASRIWLVNSVRGWMRAQLID